MKNSGFYELRLLEAKDSGEPVYFVRETHGRWDDHKKRVVYDKDSLMPPEGFRSFEDAEKSYCRERLTLAEQGFIHSLVWHPFADGHSEYRLIA